MATSQNFWRKMFVVHFGRRETSVESARMRRRINAATARLAASNSTVGLCKAGTADDTAGIASAAAAAVVVVAAWDWRGAFKEAVCTEWRWMGGRCMRTNDWVGHSDRVVRVALYNGRAITAALDGSVRIWDVKSGENIAVFRRRKFEFSSSDIERQRGRRRDAGSDSYRRDDSGEETDGDAETDSGVGNDIGQAAGPTGDEVSGREAVGGVEAISDDAINGVEVVSSGEEDHHNPDDAEVMPVLCLAVDNTGLAVAGMSDGTVTVYDVAVGQRLHCSRVGTEPVVSVAVGAGWLVAGLSSGGVEVRAARDGSRFLRLESASRTFHFPRSPSSTRVLEAAEAPQHADIVRCLEIDARSGLAAAASGMYVAVWALGRDDNISIAADSSSPRHVWLKGHTEPVRALCFAALSPVHRNISTTALVTGGDDATIRVWDAQSGRCLRELEGPPGTTEAEHAGQVPVGWTYRPPPGITCVSVWANQVVEGRDDGSVLVWTGVFEGLEEDAEAAAAAAAGVLNSRIARGGAGGVGGGVAALIMRQLSREGGQRRRQQLEQQHHQQQRVQQQEEEEQRREQHSHGFERQSQGLEQQSQELGQLSSEGTHVGRADREDAPSSSQCSVAPNSASAAPSGWASESDATLDARHEGMSGGLHGASALANTNVEANRLFPDERDGAYACEALTPP